MLDDTNLLNTMNLSPKNLVTWKLSSLNFPKKFSPESKNKCYAWHAPKSCEYFKQMLLTQFDSYPAFASYDMLAINQTWSIWMYIWSY